MSKVYNTLKNNLDRLFFPYQSMFLYGIIIILLLEIVPFYSNRNIQQSVTEPLLNRKYLILYLCIIIFLVNPLRNYMYSIKYKSIPIHHLFTFWYKSVICNLFLSITLIISTLLLIFPMFYMKYRFMFLPFYIIEKYDELSCFEIIKTCWKEDNTYSFIEIFCLDILVLIIGRFFLKFYFLVIFVIPIYISLYQVLYINRNKNIESN